MNRWQQTVNVADLWQQAKNGEPTAHELGVQLSKRLGGKWGLGDIPQQFAELPEDATMDDFDDLLDLLYDRANYDKCLWIETYKSRP